MARIIIVDDKEQDRYLLQVLLQNSGFTVDAAVNGTDALAIARKSPPDLVVSDILMPGMDGFNLCREWKNDSLLNNVPFMFYTATYTDPRDEQFALHLGADKFIVKPAEPEEILRSVKELLAAGIGHVKKTPALSDAGGKEFFKGYSEALVRKLEEKLELFSAIFMMDPGAFFLLSPSLTIQEMNRSAELLLGIAGNEVFDTPFFDHYIPGDERNGIIKRINSVLSGEMLRDFVCPVATVHGTERILSWNARRLMNSSGELAGIVLIGNDITEHLAVEEKRAEMERQFIQAQRMEAIGRLAGGVAHDFNNYLSAIMGFCDLLQFELGTESLQTPKIRQIIECAERAARLTKQLLVFSRKQVLEKKTVNLNDIISTMESMVRRLIGEDITFSAVLFPGLYNVTTDPGLIEQVIMNLAVNSRDAMPQGGVLTVATNNVTVDAVPSAAGFLPVADDYISITVTDTGCGMDDATMARMFEPFFTTKEIGKGTGLGLATVYGIIKQNGGDIRCKSVPGAGTTFTIYLPAAGDEIGNTEKAKSMVAFATGTATETILVVEDDETTRNVTVMLLKMAGYSVVTATDGRDALEVSLQFRQPIQLLLTDMVMPGVGGKMLAEQLLKQRPGIKILYTSGYSDNIIACSIPAPGEYFLQKPFNYEILTRKVREVLDVAN